MREPKSGTGSDSKAGPLQVIETIRIVDSEELRDRQLTVILRLLRPAYELRKSDQVDPDARDPRLAQAVEALRPRLRLPPARVWARLGKIAR